MPFSVNLMRSQVLYRAAQEKSASHTIKSNSTFVLLQSNGMQTKSVSRPIGRKADVGIQSGHMTQSAAPVRVTMA